VFDLRKRSGEHMSSSSKGNAIWETFKTAVPGLADKLESSEPPLEDSGVAFMQLMGSLPDDVQELIRANHLKADEISWQKEIKHVWCLCDMAEGEFPKTYEFDTLHELVAAMTRAEGRETALVAFYGVRLPFSKVQATNAGKRYRCLFLPNEMVALTGEQFQLIEQSLLDNNIEIEEQGWVGDPAFLETPTYYTPGYVEDDEFSADPDFDDDDDGLAPDEA